MSAASPHYASDSCMNPSLSKNDTVKTALGKTTLYLWFKYIQQSVATSARQFLSLD